MRQFVGLTSIDFCCSVATAMSNPSRNSSTSSITGRTSFLTSSSQTDIDDSRRRDSTTGSEFLLSCVDFVLDESSNPLLDFDSHRSGGSSSRNFWDVHEAAPTMSKRNILKRQSSESDIDQLRMNREEGGTLSTKTAVKVSGMDIVRRHHGLSARVDDDAKTL
jgi:hypothetical protein